jgi:hypothetical protein
MGFCPGGASETRGLLEDAARGSAMITGKEDLLHLELRRKVFADWTDRAQKGST